MSAHMKRFDGKRLIVLFDALTYAQQHTLD